MKPVDSAPGAGWWEEHLFGNWVAFAEATEKCCAVRYHRDFATTSNSIASIASIDLECAAGYEAQQFRATSEVLAAKVQNCTKSPNSLNFEGPSKRASYDNSRPHPARTFGGRQGDRSPMGWSTVRHSVAGFCHRHSARRIVRVRCWTS